MIPKQAIEKAIEGGWNDKIGGHYEEIGFWQTIALDPTFWQALGKALGWNGLILELIPDADRGKIIDPNEWHGHALDFYDLILTGGDTEAFWNELLK
jgi:hypothetical protein